MPDNKKSVKSSAKTSKSLPLKRVVNDPRNFFYKWLDINNDEVKSFDLPSDVYDTYQQQLSNNKGKKFGVVSKNNAKAYFFDEDGNLAVQDEVGLGSDRGEAQPVFYKVKTTPSGTYHMKRPKLKPEDAEHMKKGYDSNNFFYIDNTDPNKRLIDVPGSTRPVTPRQAMHGIPVNLKSQRLQAFDNGDVSDNNMSAGCINCRRQFLDNPYFNEFNEGYVYVTPEMSYSNSSNAVAKQPQVPGNKKQSVAKQSTNRKVVVPAQAYTGNSLVDYLNQAGIDSSKQNRAAIAAKLGIDNYDYSGEQNSAMLQMLKQNGTLVDGFKTKPSSLSKYGGSTFSGNAWYGNGGSTNNSHVFKELPTAYVTAKKAKKKYEELPEATVIGKTKFRYPSSASDNTAAPVQLPNGQWVNGSNLGISKKKINKSLPGYTEVNMDALDALTDYAQFIPGPIGIAAEVAGLGLDAYQAYEAFKNNRPIDGVVNTAATVLPFIPKSTYKTIGNILETGYDSYSALENSRNYKKNGGEMIRRADGSYSRRGLWDNIRDNKGSGKEPTKEMLEQERKIKKAEAGGSTFSGNAWYDDGGLTDDTIDWKQIQKKYNDAADASYFGPEQEPQVNTTPVSFQQDAVNKGIIQAPVSSAAADQNAYAADPKQAFKFDSSLVAQGDQNYINWFNNKYKGKARAVNSQDLFNEKVDRLADGLMDKTFGNPWSLYNMAGYANNIVSGINNRRDRKEAERRERDNYSTMGMYPAMAPGMMSRGIRAVSGTMRNMDFPNQISGNNSFQGMQQNYFTPFQTAETGLSVMSDYAPGEMMSEFVPDYTPSLTPVAKDIKENYTVPEVKPTTGMNVEEADTDLKEFIAQKESEGNYKALPLRNGKLVSSAAGKYQFLWNTHKNAIGSVTGVRTKDEFLNSPEAQEKYMDYWDKTVLTPTAQKIKAAGVNAPLNKIKYMVHFAGPKGAMDYFLHGKETQDGFGMTTSKQASRMNISSYGGEVEMNEEQIMNFLAMGGEIEYVED